MSDRGAEVSRSRDVARAVAVGVLLPVVSAVVANATWDGTYLLIPAVWLLAAVVLATLTGWPGAAVTAVVVTVVIDDWLFVPPRHSVRTRTLADLTALLGFAAIAIGVSLVVHQTSRARRRADRSLASLDALLEHAPVGIAFLDRDLRFIRVNDTLAQLDPRMSEELGSSLDELFGRDDVSALARSVLETGRAVPEVRVTREREGLPVMHAVAGYYPVFGPDGAIDGVGVVVRDVTAEVVAERERDHLLERVTRLQAITEALAMSATTLDIIRVVLEHVRVAVGADAASLCRIADDHIQVIGAEGLTDTALAAWQRVPLDAPNPLTESIRSGRVVIAENHAEIRRRWPEMVASLDVVRQAVVALPLVVDGVSQGAIALSFDEERTFGPDDESFFLAVATQCAEGLLRARLFESEHAAHLAAEQARDRLAFLAEASDILAGSLEWERTLRQVAALAVPRLADFAAVFLIDDGRIKAAEMAHHDPERVPALQRMIDRWPPDLDQLVGLGAVARTGVPLLVGDIQPEELARVRSEEHAAAIVAAGFRSLLAVPMRNRDKVTGLIVLATDPPRSLDGVDLALATELATRAGQAIVNAELFRDRSHVAATLQASLLPPAIPTLPGLDVASRFFAVGEGIEVGGDFYDIFPMGRSADTSAQWAVVVGDVRGKGTEAAAVSGAARHAIRAIALHERSPAMILDQLNELLLVLAQDDPEPRFCTAVVAAVHPRAGGATVVLAVGGHPPPLVLRADGTTEAVRETGTLIGVLEHPSLSDQTIELGPGDSLVLYTDGVTERHEGDRFFDEDGLAAVLSRCTGFTAPVLAERIETAARAFVEDAPRDDLAIVVVRVPESVATATSATTELPGDTSAPGRGRRFVIAALAALGADRHAATAALLASELVTNAVLHGAAPFRIAVETDAGRVRVTVTDGSTDPPLLMDEDDQRISGRGMRLVDVLANGWGVEPNGTGKSVWFELDP